MSRDLETLLREVAPEPATEFDARGLVDRALRQRRVFRVGIAAAVIVLLVAVSAVVGTLATTTPSLEVVGPDVTPTSTGGGPEGDGETVTWRSIAASPLGARSRHAIVAADGQMVVWGGVDDPGSGDPNSSSGAIYEPADDAWQRIEGAPIEARHDPFAVWLDDQVFIWGGSAATAGGDDQAALYEPATDTWRPAARFPSITAAAGVAVWTGDRVIVWGQPLGSAPPDTPPVTAAYDPVADRWAELATSPIAGRAQPSGVWTGEELIVFGGAHADDGNSTGARTGAAYNPATDTWRVLAEAPIEGRFGHSAVWTGQEMIVWGGTTTDGPHDVLNDGAAYNPAQDRWRTLPAGPLSGRYNHLASWTGTHMAVFGGQVRTGGSTWNYPLDTAAYHPATRQWFSLGELPRGIDWWNAKAVSLPDQTVYWGEVDGIETAGALPHQPLPASPAE